MIEERERLIRRLRRAKPHSIAAAELRVRIRDLTNAMLASRSGADE